MIMVAVVAAVLAVLLGMPRSTDPLRRLGQKPAVVERRRRIPWWTPGLLVLPVVAGVLAGTAAATVVLVLIMVGGTVVWMLRAWRVGRRIARESAQVANACAVLAGQCRVGLPPLEALRTAAVDHPILAEAVAVGDLGGDLPAAWRAQSTHPGRGGLLALSRAWQVSNEVGAPMADALDQVARTLAADRAVGTVVNGELAAPRATSRLLGGLPVFGVVLGVSLGGDPLTFLLQHPIGQGCLIAGVLLACLGLVWVERLATSLGGAAR
ncbi:type II secretion system F family protein [Propionibacteriaceae bacterium Y1685]